jgi:hypothetical protein
MILGILSDTHDNIPKIIKAVEFFNSKKVDFVFHAGDFVAPFTIDRMNGLACEWRGVFGNNDGEKNGLKAKSKGRIRHPPLRIKLKGRNVALVHDIKSLDLAKDGSDIIIFGHTHKPEVVLRPRRLIVNPGECGGWLYGRSTIALVDSDSLRARIIKI